ncbi:DUF3429 domain-containing protein [Fulvimarina sp. 2208YS6-2-32]|uniref:DUF3429 domain-containing protein n=1 Tax=Fulvimarina uroteuthidis TaxID=3098149 RepID=A0ABU5HZB4_9HYPH|nr:DUF3429 domain-containing protein [Fulvimarina sp. 2208YS6-2-32]MDY8108395.1 DUF3429 domain-containing protein [Fulvimarina sp. 2208YS6-2-32]
MSSDRTESRTIRAEEPAEIPGDGLFFGYLAMLPLVAGAIGLFVLPDNWAFLTLNLTLFWGAAILTFLAGVRRGVSFRQPGGPKATQLAMMLFLFLTGFGATVAVVWAYPLLGIGLEIAGYLALAILDPISARKGRAPLYFAKLRPLQMVLPIASLAAVAYWVSTSGFF